jgi:hypothetical protein
MQFQSVHQINRAGQVILYNLTVYYATIMLGRLNLNTSNLPTLSENESAQTASPARGKEMRQNILKQLRVPSFVHTWEFYHDRQDRKGDPAVASSSDSYEARLVRLAQMNDIKEFWSVLNNFDIAALEKKDSIHLFHKGVKPLWEDPRNLKGGSWTFKVQKTHGPDFWKELCLLAVGEQLQNAVATDRKSMCFLPYRLSSSLVEAPQTLSANNFFYSIPRRHLRHLADRQVDAPPDLHLEPRRRARRGDP